MHCPKVVLKELKYTPNDTMFQEEKIKEEEEEK